MKKALIFTLVFAAAVGLTIRALALEPGEAYVYNVACHTEAAATVVAKLYQENKPEEAHDTYFAQADSPCFRLPMGVMATLVKQEGPTYSMTTRFQVWQVLDEYGDTEFILPIVR